MTSRTHLIGLLLGTEEDWPRAFEHLLAQVGPIEHGGETHELTTERISNEPFDLRSKRSFSGGFLCGISQVSGTRRPSRIIAQ